MKHIIRRRLTENPEGIAEDCSCGAGIESAGRDESSRRAVTSWVFEHRAANQ